MGMQVTFELDDEDLKHFELIMREARKSAANAPPEVIVAGAEKLLQQIGNSRVPAFIMQRLQQLRIMIRMLADPEWRQWSPHEYRRALLHPLAEAGFQKDMSALRWCDAVVAVQPFGRSASMELGWAVGAGKRTFLLVAEGEPELMAKMCNHVCIDVDDVVMLLDLQ